MLSVVTEVATDDGAWVGCPPKISESSVSAVDEHPLVSKVTIVRSNTPIVVDLHLAKKMFDHGPTMGDSPGYDRL